MLLTTISPHAQRDQGGRVAWVWSVPQPRGSAELVSAGSGKEKTMLPGAQRAEPDSHLHLFSRAVITEYHNLCGLKQEFIALQFWKMEVQNPGAVRAVLPVTRIGKPFLDSELLVFASNPGILWLVDITPVSAFIVTWPSILVCLFSSYRNTSHV